MTTKTGPTLFMTLSYMLLWSLIVFAVPALAQTAGTGGKGSFRPAKTDRAIPQTERSLPTPSPAPRDVASATVSPTPTPEGELEVTEEKGTDPGTFFFIYGVNALSRPRHEEGASSSVVGGFGFNVYVTRRLFVEVDNDNFVSLKPLVGSRTTGFGDTVLIVGYDAVLENLETNKPNVSFFYGVKAPTASSTKNLGSGKVDHLLFGTISKSLRGRTSSSFVELDFLEYFAGRGEGNGFARSSNLAGIFRQWLDDKRTSRFHFEVGGKFATKESNAEMYTLDYFEHFPNDRVSFRIGGRFGLTPNVPKAGIYLALTFTGKLK